MKYRLYIVKESLPPLLHINVEVLRKTPQHCNGFIPYLQGVTKILIISKYEKKECL